jgi:hypothetical protein
MEQTLTVSLLKTNFSKVEEKFDDFFRQGVPRWPGEERDFLRNHHKRLEDLPLKSLTFERLGVKDLPEDIMEELKKAFEAFQNNNQYA